MTTFDDAVEEISSQKHLLFEAEPAEEVWNWTAHGNGFTNTYWATWNHLAQTSVIKGGLFRKLIGVEEDGTALLELSSITLVEANAGSFYYDGTAYPATDYDGVTDHYTRGAALTGAADAKTLLFSCWIRKDGNDAAVGWFIRELGPFIRLGFNASNKIVVMLKNDAEALITNHSSDTTYSAGLDLLHVLIAVDQATDTLQLYVNDASVATTGAALTDDEIAFDKGDWGIGANHNSGADLFSGVMSEFYFTNEYLDISVEANRRKFIDSEGLPADLGNDGETPTGTQPLVYAPDGDPSDNRGSGGDFTAVGSPTSTTIGPRIFVHTSGSADPDTLDMMAAVFRVHFSTTGKTFTKDTSEIFGTLAHSFDGTNDWYTRADTLDGVVDGPECIFSCWFRLDGGNGTAMYLFSGYAVSRFVGFARNAANRIYAGFLDATGALIASATSVNTYTASAIWHHVYVSLDVAAKELNIYVDGADELFGLYFPLATDVDFTLSRWDISAYMNSTSKLNGATSELYFNPAEYLAGAAGVLKFRDTNGDPVGLGADGSTPTGNQPAVYVPDDDGTNNLGSGGDFTKTGSPLLIAGPSAQTTQRDYDCYYEKRILTDSGARITERASDLVVGMARTSSGGIKLANHDSLFDILVRDWNWKGRPARLMFGLDDIDLDEYITLTEQVIDDVAITEEAMTLSLVERADTWLQRFPIGFYPTSTITGQGVDGTRIPILVGAKTDIIPDLVDNEDNAVNEWIYRIADTNYQTLDAVSAVYAINKSTGARQTLTLAVDYTVNLTACTITVDDSFDAGAEIDEEYEIRCDAAGMPADTRGTSTDYLKYPGEIAHWMLNTFLNYDDGDLDLDSFADADANAPCALAFWIKAETNVRAVIRKLGVSVLGDVRTGTDGTVKFYLWTPWEGTADAEALSDEDFSSFEGDVKVETVYYETKIRYDEDAAKPGSWEVETATDAGTGHLFKGSETLKVDTFLTTSADAAILATHINLLYRGKSVEVIFKERGIRLMEAGRNARILVTKTRAPSPGGAFDSRMMEITEITKDLLAPSVSGRLADKNIINLVGKWAAATAPAWEDASGEEKAASGFWTDANGLADASDRASKGVSIWW